MPQPSFAERIHYDGTREYTNHQGNVAYLDGTPLQRPSKMPAAQRIIALVIVAVAIVIGLFMVNRFVVSRITEAATAEQAVQDNLAREASLVTVPNVASLINLDNDAIRAAFAAAGYTIFDATDENEVAEMVLYKLPADVSVDDAAVLYAQGVGSLNAQQASRLLNGSWYFNADRAAGVSMVCRYADFSTGDPQIAVQNALSQEGIDPASATESGVDDSGNTFTSGTIDVEGTACIWKISALPLDEMYSIAGLPEDACYVGIRVTAA